MHTKPFFSKHYIFVVALFFILGVALLSSSISRQQGGLAADITSANNLSATDSSNYRQEALGVTTPLLHSAESTCNDAQSSYSKVAFYRPTGSASHTNNIDEIFSIHNLHGTSQAPRTVLVVYLKTGEPAIYLDQSSQTTILADLAIPESQFQTACGA